MVRSALPPGRRFGRAPRLGSIAGHAALLTAAIAMLAAAALVPLAAREARAQGKPLLDPPAAKADAGAPPDAAEPEEPGARDSPRASVAQWNALCRERRFEEAARYLDLPPKSEGDGPRLAMRLKAVLDRHAWIDLSQISPLPLGDPADGLPPGTDSIARIPGPDGKLEPVRLVRRTAPDGSIRWVFSRATVERIDGWYRALEHRWFHDNLPAWLLRPGPRELLWWQWLALPLLGAASWAVSFLPSGLTRALFRPLALRTRTKWDDEILARSGGPLTAAWALVVAWAALPLLGLYAPAYDFAEALLRALGILVFFWALLRAVAIARDMVASSAFATERPAVRSLVPLGARLAQVIVLAFAAIAAFSELGYPVASLLAGLGIGGLALALAAQKTVENLFGALSIAVDQPLRVGDFVRVDDFMGTVETIGMRSTRIRTLDRTLITVPNGKLAEMRIESLTARDRMRLHGIFPLVLGTTAAQMRAVLEGFEEVLGDHPMVVRDETTVRFRGLGPSALEVEVNAWFSTSEWNVFTKIRQDVLLDLLAVVERAGTALAYPTQTLHVVARSPGERPAEAPLAAGGAEASGAEGRGAEKRGA